MLNNIQIIVSKKNKNHKLINVHNFKTFKNQKQTNMKNIHNGNT